MIKVAFVSAALLFAALVVILLVVARRWWKARTRGEKWLRRVEVGIVLLLLIGFVLAVWAFLIEPNRLVVNHQVIQIKTWPTEISGLRVAVIGDIHTGAPFIDDEKLRRLVELTNQQQPDLVVMPGDFMSQDTWHGHRVAPEITANHLRGLRAPLGVYAVLGNHDWWDDGEKVQQAFDDAGIRVLENEAVEIKWRDKSFWLAGFSDAWTRPQRFEETVAGIPPGSTIVGFSHNPDIFPSLPSNVTLLLAAHTHGGQVKIPLIGTPIVPSRFGQKYVAGHVYESGRHLFVTTGVGTSVLPVRFRVPPEIVILTVRS